MLTRKLRHRLRHTVSFTHRYPRTVQNYLRRIHDLLVETPNHPRMRMRHQLGIPLYRTPNNQLHLGTTIRIPTRGHDSLLSAQSLVTISLLTISLSVRRHHRMINMRQHSQCQGDIALPISRRRRGHRLRKIVNRLHSVIRYDTIRRNPP